MCGRDICGDCLVYVDIEYCHYLCKPCEELNKELIQEIASTKERYEEELDRLESKLRSSKEG